MLGSENSKGIVNENKVALATNNGDIGGGEVMMFNIAQALTELGISLSIVGPAYPSEVVDTARERGFATQKMEKAESIFLLVV